MVKRKSVRVLAASVLPRFDEDPVTPAEELAEAWREAERLPNTARWDLNDYLRTFADCGFPVDAEMMRHFVKSAMAAYEASCERQARPAAPMRDPRPPHGRHDPVVYYFRLGDLVKIGTSVDVHQRRTQVPCQGVMAVEWGSFELETQRHGEFIDSHQWGEWYRLTAPVGQHIVDVRESFERAVGCTTEVWLARHR